jgi:Ca2+/H+ antiporter, TMEM165/GDT1 family
MDWKVMASTFGLIFLAEMGDKTQLAAITLVAETKRPVAVFVGASLALLLVSLLGVVVGSVLTQYVPTEYLEKAAAVAFIVIGVLMLVGRL